MTSVSFQDHQTLIYQPNTSTASKHSPSKYHTTLHKEKIPPQDYHTLHQLPKLHDDTVNPLSTSQRRLSHQHHHSHPKENTINNNNNLRHIYRHQQSLKPSQQISHYNACIVMSVPPAYKLRHAITTGDPLCNITHIKG